MYSSGEDCVFLQKLSKRGSEWKARIRRGSEWKACIARAFVEQRLFIALMTRGREFQFINMEEAS